MTKNIMIVGVGGQGSLLASRIIGDAALIDGHDVKVSEVHGMSQRGGSVVTYVKYGKKVASPIICKGEADIILSFELLEAARWLPYLKKNGTIVVNTQKINPMPVVNGTMEYPEELVKKMKDKGINVIAADTLEIAKQAGNEKAANVALIGLASKYLGFSEETLEKALEEAVPQKFLELNKKAFALGVAAVE